MERKNTGRLENISFLKTLMMITVVAYHCFLFFGGNWFKAVEPHGAGYFYDIALFMNTFHVQAFTMASGFLFFYLQKGKCDRRNEIKKRAKRLLLPYLFVAIFWAIPIGSFFFHWPIGEIVRRFLLAFGPNQLWFLIMLFGVSLFFIIFYSRIEISTKNLIIIYVISTACSAVLSYYDMDAFQLSKITQYILYFYLGGYIFRNDKKITRKQLGVLVPLAVVLYAGLSTINTVNPGFTKYVSKLVMPFFSVIVLSIIYYLCTALVKRVRLIQKVKLYKVLEKNSFGIYLFHQQIIYFVIYFFNDAVNPFILVLLSFSISIFISIIISSILRRFRITRLMFGL